MKHYQLLNEYVLPDRLPIFVARKLPGEHENCSFHDHEYSEIALVLNGTAQHCMGDRRCLLQTGNIVVLHPGMVHTYQECDREFELINIAYAVERLPLPQLDGYHLPLFKILFSSETDSYDALEPVMSLNRAEMEPILESAMRLYDETISLLPGNMLMTLALFLETVTALARCYRGTPALQSTRFQLGRTIAYLNSHYAENITVEDLTRQANVSERNLYRLFRTMTGYSPHHYLLHLRLNHAAVLLEHSDASLEEIAQRCGFCDANHFCRRFREQKGITPQRFRRNSASRKMDPQ